MSSQDRSLLRKVNQMLDLTKNQDQSWQRTLKQFLHDMRHEPVSRISERIRELKWVFSLFEERRKEGA